MRMFEATARNGRRMNRAGFEFHSLETRRLLSAVVGRHLFYDNSYFDLYSPGPSPADDAAVAVDKHALLPGEQPGFANYSSYDRGINGIIIDIAKLGNPPGLSANDFEFAVAQSPAADQW